jgi:hypothetical protein
MSRATITLIGTLPVSPVNCINKSAGIHAKGCNAGGDAINLVTSIPV